MKKIDFCVQQFLKYWKIIGNSIKCQFLKLVIYVRGGHSDYSPRKPKIKKNSYATVYNCCAKSSNVDMKQLSAYQQLHTRDTTDANAKNHVIRGKHKNAQIMGSLWFLDKGHSKTRLSVSLPSSDRLSLGTIVRNLTLAKRIFMESDTSEFNKRLRRHTTV